MYPFIRLAKNMLIEQFKPKMGIDEEYVSYHICWPWDLDFAFELNNGRTLSLYDLGRIPFGHRVGLTRVMIDNGWLFTMAGATVRYRRRVKVFQRIKMTSKLLGRDDKFFYIGQSMWRRGECTSSIVYRTAMTDKNGLVRSQPVCDAFGLPDWNPPLPEWVSEWIDQENKRTWPPEF